MVQTRRLSAGLLKIAFRLSPDSSYPSTISIGSSPGHDRGTTFDYKVTVTSAQHPD